MYDDNAKTMARQPGPHEALESETAKRADEADARASELERQAREWRAVERACRAALAALGEVEPEPAYDRP
jgi:hypothetical protein